VTSIRGSAGYRQSLAWFITVPLSIVVIVIASPMAVHTHLSAYRWPATIALFLVFLFAHAGELHVEVQRHTFAFLLLEIPLLLALFYLPPLLVIAVRVLSFVVVKGIARITFTKLMFNVASLALGTAVACAIVRGIGINGVGPKTWLVLALAVGTNSAISIAAVIAVISLVQGPPPARAVLRMVASAAVVTMVNIVLGLIVLVVIQVQPWSILLLAGLSAMLLVVYRSYAQFVGQHRSLSELYDLTLAMGDASRNGTLPDVLLARVRDLLSAEYATLWLPANGRYPEVLLSAHVNSTGLLDVSNTPSVIRDRAVRDAATVVVGPKLGDPGLRALIRDSGIKDAIVVPLRSGSAVIGLLEVTGRLGDSAQFKQPDVRLLETLAAQAAVAVENSRLVDRLRFDAYHDALTGLPNRRRFVALLEEAVKVRAPNEVVAVLLFDIDGLRDVNDSLGHDAGDQMVREVAARLRLLAPAAAQVGRAGSDEFVLAVRLSAADQAQELAVQMRAAVQAPMLIDGITLDVDVAIGIALLPEHGAEAELLLKRADLAVQAAKRLVTPINVFRPSLQARSVQRSGLASDLRRALDGDELEVHFQPKVALADRRVVGVECLARWNHPTHGPVTPTEFIPVAEQTGQLARLTDVVLREGLRRARGWYESGRSMPVAVNLSVRTLIDPTFAHRVRDLLDESAVPASLLTLEITEDGIFGEPDRPLSTLRRLHELGVRLSVDDFGTGHSPLSYLRRVPVHEVKIDRSFVQGMATETGDLAVVRSVVDLARNFGLVAVAEGVESELSVSLLEGAGCDVGQGFLFSRALPFERLEAWLALQTEPVPDSPSVPGQGAEVRRLRAVP
jgi:diguanylate cyclase (GGDEF)-like protein